MGIPCPLVRGHREVVLWQYFKGLAAVDLAKKVSLELEDKTLMAAVSFVESIKAGLERFAGLNRTWLEEEPMDTSAIQPTANEEILAIFSKIQRGKKIW